LQSHRDISDESRRKFETLIAQINTGEKGAEDCLEFFKRITLLDKINEVSEPWNWMFERGWEKQSRERLEHIEIMTEAVNRLIKEDLSYFNAHQYVELGENVMRQVFELINSLSVDNREIISIAASLHDYGILVSQKRHYGIGKLLVKDLLQGLGYDKYETIVVSSLVETHGDFFQIYMGREEREELYEYIEQLAEDLDEQGLLSISKEELCALQLNRIAGESPVKLFNLGRTCSR